MAIIKPRDATRRGLAIHGDNKVLKLFGQPRRPGLGIRHRRASPEGGAPWRTLDGARGFATAANKTWTKCNAPLAVRV